MAMVAIIVFILVGSKALVLYGMSQSKPMTAIILLIPLSLLFIGHILFTRIHIVETNGAKHESLALAQWQYCRNSKKKGIGIQLIKMALPYFFKNYKLKNLFCEPYALNPAPNKTLKKVGFTFVKKHVTIPGSLNFEQQVNLWVMSAEDFNLLK